MIERMNFKQQIFTLIDFEPKKPGVFLDFGLKVNVNAGQNKFEVHISTNLPKMAINWHKIGQMPLSTLVIFHPIFTIFSKCLFFKRQIEW